MADTDIFIAAVVDRSGSMQSIWKATIESFDHFVEEQAKVGQGWISLTVFDDEINHLHRAWGLSDLPKFATMGVYPRGTTAMYDAIGAALDEADSWLAQSPWFSGTKMCMIQTDGLENASKKLDQDAIFKIIRAHEADGWTFVYLGANQDSWAVAKGMGMTNSAAVLDYAANTIGTQSVYAAHTAGTSALRSGGGYSLPKDSTSKDKHASKK